MNTRIDPRVRDYVLTATGDLARDDTIATEVHLRVATHRDVYAFNAPTDPDPLGSLVHQLPHGKLPGTAARAQATVEEALRAMVRAGRVTSIAVDAAEDAASSALGVEVLVVAADGRKVTLPLAAPVGR